VEMGCVKLERHLLVVLLIVLQFAETEFVKLGKVSQIVPLIVLAFRDVQERIVVLTDVEEVAVHVRLIKSVALVFVFLIPAKHSSSASLSMTSSDLVGLPMASQLHLHVVQ